MAVTQANLTTDLTRIIQDSSYDTTEQLTFLNQALQEIAGDTYIDRRGGRHEILLPYLETQSDVTTDTDNPYVSLPSNYQKNLFFVYNTTKYWKVQILPSLGDLYRRFQKLNQSGTILGVAIKGKYLHYQRIPSTAEALQLHYYRKPYEMITYSADTISFDDTGNTIEDTASGLGDFNVGDVVDITGPTNNASAYTITEAAADSLTVSETVVTEASGTEFTIKSRPDGLPEHLVRPLLLNHAAAAVFSEIEQGIEGQKVDTAYYTAKFNDAMERLIAFIGPDGRAPQPINDELNLEAYL